MACKCENQLGSLTFAPCSVEDFGAIVGMFIAPTYQKDGKTKNSITVGTTGLTDVLLNAKLFNADPYQRFQLITGLREALLSPPEQITTEYTDKTKRLVGYTNQMFSAILNKESFTWINQLKLGRCVGMSVWFVSDDNQILGYKQAGSDANFGIPINQNVIDSIYTFAQKNVSAPKQTITFDLDNSVKQENFYIIPDDMIASSIIDLTGIREVNLVNNTSIVGVVKVSANSIYGNQKGYAKVSGITSAFVVKRNGVVVNSLVKTEPLLDGDYLLTGAGVTAGNYEVSCVAFTEGLDIKPVTFVIA